MKISIIGRGGVSESYKRAFQKLGQSVFFVNPLKLYPFYGWLDNRLSRYVLWVFLSFFSQSALVRHVVSADPDFILVEKGRYVGPMTIKAIKQKTKSPIFYYSSDDLKNPLNTNPPMLRSISLYDHVFTPRKVAVEEIKKEHGTPASFCPFSLDPEIHYPIDVTDKEMQEMGADVIFIGTWAPDKRVEYLERLCNSGYDIKVYGNSWEKLASNSCLWRRGCIQQRPVYGRDFCRALCASKIAVSFLRKDNRDRHTMRTFEITGCGALLFHERTDEVASIFKDGKEAILFDSYNDFKDRVDYYLERPQERLRIAKNGLERVRRAENTYIARARHVIEIYNKHKNAS